MSIEFGQINFVAVVVAAVASFAVEGQRDDNSALSPARTTPEGSSAGAASSGA